MRTNLLVAIQDIDRPVIVITSARPAEGKTSTLANLAPIVALAGHRVIAVDFDLRYPDLHAAMDIPNDRGVADVLRGDAALEDCMKYVEVAGPTPGTGLYVLPAGSATTDPAELIGSPRTPRLLEVLSEQADIVLMDAPPVLGFADTLILGRLATGVVLVVEARKTPVPVIQEAKDALIRNQARLLGLVVSKLDPRDASTLDGSSDYYYSYGGTPGLARSSPPERP